MTETATELGPMDATIITYQTTLSTRTPMMALMSGIPITILSNIIPFITMAVLATRELKVTATESREVLGDQI